MALFVPGVGVDFDPMHEYGMVQDLLSQVDQQVRVHEGKRAVRVVLAIDGGHVEERFLRDAFNTFKGETSARDAELVVTHAPVEAWCSGCGARATVSDEDLACPQCGAPVIRMTSTEEIVLQSVEIEV